MTSLEAKCVNAMPSFTDNWKWVRNLTKLLENFGLLTNTPLNHKLEKTKSSIKASARMSTFKSIDTDKVYRRTQPSVNTGGIIRGHGRIISLGVGMYPIEMISISASGLPVYQSQRPQVILQNQANDGNLSSKTASFHCSCNKDSCAKCNARTILSLKFSYF